MVKFYFEQPQFLEIMIFMREKKLHTIQLLVINNREIKKNLKFSIVYSLVKLGKGKISLVFSFKTSLGGKYTFFLY